MADNASPDWHEAAIKLGIALAIVGALIGYGREETGGAALAGAMAGFALGCAIVRFIVAATIAGVATIAAFFAWQTIKTTSSTLAQTPALPVWFNNDCPREVRLFVKWRDPAKGWTINGSWVVNPNEKRFLTFEDNSRVIAASPEIYFYAYVAGEDIQWKGDFPETFNGHTLPMLKANIRKDGSTSYDFTINCPDK